MKYTDYQLSAEYRDRHGFNQGDLFFLKEALGMYVKAQAEEIDRIEKEGGQSIVAPAFFEQLAESLLLKAEAFLYNRPTFEDEE